MLTISHTEDTHPAKAFADACWAQNPALTPDHWRELDGITVGRVALDWREDVGSPAAVAQGFNLILTSVRTHAQAAALLAQTLSNPAAAVTACVLEDPAAQLPTLSPAPTFAIWQPPYAVAGFDETAARQLLALENAAKSGLIQAYGVADIALAAPQTSRPLHRWLQHAAQAAEAAWGRRKRPALRLLAAPFDLLTPGLLTHATSLHHESPVTTLEHAARLSLGVIALPQAAPGAQPSAAAVSALTAAAEAEQQLLAALRNQWPQVENHPLFSLLLPLSEGLPPWSTPAEAVAWCTLLPELSAQWSSLPLPAAAGRVLAAYLPALSALPPHAPALAGAAAQSHLRAVFSHISPKLPPAWQSLNPAALNLALLASFPAVTAVSSAAEPPASLLTLPTLPDAAILFK